MIAERENHEAAPSGRISERRFVQVPSASAPVYLGAYVHDIQADCAGRIALSFTLTLERLGFDRGLKMTKAVTVGFRRAEQSQNVTRAWAVDWQPDSGPYPHFKGTLTIEADPMSTESSYVALEGVYDPPFSRIGDAFDAIVGKHIARVTARNLLDEIAIVMETSHASNGDL